jgi:protease IV
MHVLLTIIKQTCLLFWKIITFIRSAIMNILFFGGLLFIYFLYLNTTSTPEVVAIKPAALVLNLSGPIVEQKNYANPLDSISNSVLGQDLPKDNLLFDIVDVIRAAKTDDKITGIVLSLSNMSDTNLTKLRYIAKALTEFKKTGKPIFAIGDFYTQSQYYLASYADKIYLSPDGAVLLKGYSAYSMYYKSLLEKLNVNTHVFRVGTYKSAIEPFIRDDMSEAARLSASNWVNQLWNSYTSDVAANRHIKQSVLSPTITSFNDQLNSVAGDIAQLSLNVGLVDKLANRLDTRQDLIAIFGSNGADNYNAINFYDYLASLPAASQDAQDEIAVIVASGTIMDGQQPSGTIGGDSMAELLREARNNKLVKAVVLRIDSPGGSAFASEVIRNEVAALKDAGKPVVVSMSSLAASGGYWIAMSASKIIAQPTTLTGSIGIFSVLTTFEKSLNNIGVSTDGVSTTPFAAIGVTTGLTSGTKQALQMSIEHGYKRFITLVSENRGMSVEQVDNVAQGRVWTGADALTSGLVDKLGDFDDAISTAADLAGLKKYNLYWVEKPIPAAQQLLIELLSSAKAELGSDVLSSIVPPSLMPIIRQTSEAASLVNQFNDPKGHYAFCLPCNVE